MINLGNRIKELRKSKKLTQKELAEKLNLTKAAISSYETEAKLPSIETLFRMSNFFNVSSDYILGLSDSIEIKKYDLTDEQHEILEKIVAQFHELNNH